ncbi:hypothetical protein C8A05DRAFT_44184 [Staphylotrichum tortipilum]|uniref:Calcineurin-like phosphoesterase domain-containing protein n=1 Tax=Staphylotrichum tortipilum TaxID=2831512 RepID=A0AAN6MKQ8_9PEZI|nr:hypothetical protein C8A05DRAFT_44184 [Staphylotrichum longicolle]
MEQPLTSIKTPGFRRRQIAAALLSWRSPSPPAAHPNPNPNPNAIRMVCVSDTHYKQPVLPDGDILIHAGDLTENGSFDEVQAGLTWLSSQPHPFKVLVAGNHDVLLDDAFLEKYPERRYGSSKTRHNLDWGSVTYLQDSSITLDRLLSPSPTVQPPEVPATTTATATATATTSPATATTTTTTTTRNRQITILGSPWTPRYGASAFQYHPSDAATHWESQLGALPTATSTAARDLIVVTHGPPKLHLDRRDDVVLDGVRQAHDEVVMGWEGWGAVVWMAGMVVWGRVKKVVWGEDGGEGVTTFVNASVVGGRGNELVNQAAVIEI